MQLYSNQDQARAGQALRRRGWLFGGVLFVLLAAYVLLTAFHLKAFMLAALLAGLAFGVCAGDLLLLPALRYSRFLKGLEAGLRRSLACSVEKVEAETQMQDGAKVRALHLTAEDGDSRILYWNAGKLDMLPPLNTMIEITSCGRHAVAWRAL